MGTDSSMHHKISPPLIWCNIYLVRNLAFITLFAPHFHSRDACAVTGYSSQYPVWFTVSCVSWSVQKHARTHEFMLVSLVFLEPVPVNPTVTVFCLCEHRKQDTLRLNETTVDRTANKRSVNARASFFIQYYNVSNNTVWQKGKSQ